MLNVLLFVFYCSVESAKDGSKKEEVRGERFCGQLNAVFAFIHGPTDLQVYQSSQHASASESVGQGFMSVVFVDVVIDLLKCA